MRGTVYIIENGVPRTKRIMTIETTDVEQWKNAARGRLAAEGFIDCQVEFGPITEHWNKL